MKKIRTLIALAAAVLPLATLPLAASAQTANTPGGSAATGTPLDQTKPMSQPGPTGNSATSPNATNPGGTLTRGASPAVTGAPATTTGAMSDTTTGKSKMNRSKGKANETAPGEVPTYPAPAKDGTPTK